MKQKTYMAIQPYSENSRRDSKPCEQLSAAACAGRYCGWRPETAEVPLWHYSYRRSMFSLLFVEKVLKKTIYERFLSQVLHSSEKEDYHPQIQADGTILIFNFW